MDNKKTNIPSSLARIRQIMPLMLAMFAALAIVTFPSFSPDMYWHLANGREMVQSGQIISKEVFSFTHFGEKFENHEWLAQIISYLIWQKMGFYGLFCLRLLITSTIVLLGYFTARTMGGSPWLAALLCVFAVLAGLPRYSERPELFSLLNLALISFILYGYRAKRLPRGVMWFIPLILVAWNSLHGAVFGLGFLSLFVAGENIKHFFPMLRRGANDDPVVLNTLNLCYALTILAMLIDPFGLRSYGIFFGLLSNKNTYGVTEFMPLTSMMWQESMPFIFLLAWAVLLACVMFRRIDIIHLALLLVFGTFAVRYCRVASVTSIVLIPIIASLMTAAAQQPADRLRQALTKVMMLLATMFVAGFGYMVKFSGMAPPHLAFGYHLVEDYYPVGSLRFAQEIGLSGNYYNTGNFGGYLSYFAAPERKIFQYNMPLFLNSGNFVDHPEKLMQWNINYAFVGLANEFAILFPNSQWARIYRDPGGALLLKRTPQNQALIQQYEMHFFNPLMKDDALRTEARNAVILPRLTEEIGIYLAFRNDPRIASIWAEILTANPDMSNHPHIRQLLQKALKYNSSDKLVQLAS